MKTAQNLTLTIICAFILPVLQAFHVINWPWYILVIPLVIIFIITVGKILNVCSKIPCPYDNKECNNIYEECNKCTRCTLHTTYKNLSLN